MWICLNCDTKNDESSQYCACCGEKRKNRAAPDPQPPFGSDNYLTEHQYQVAKSLMQNAKTEAEYRQAINRFETLNSYKDGASLIRLCNERIVQLNADASHRGESSAQSSLTGNEKKDRNWTEFLVCGAFFALCIFGIIRGSGGFAEAWKDWSFKLVLAASVFVEIMIFMDTI